jgi:hypothetical protein
LKQRPAERPLSVMNGYDRAKHLELISKAIERMGKASFSLKALTPAAIGVALVLIERGAPSWLALSAAAVAVIVYWYLDAQYLGRERSFRRLYDRVRKGERRRPAAATRLRRRRLSSRRLCLRLPISIANSCLAPAAAPPRRTPFGRACALADTRTSVPARLRINPYGLTLNPNVLILFSSRIERERRCFMTLHNIAVSRSRTFTVTALQSRTKANVFVRNL